MEAIIINCAISGGGIILKSAYDNRKEFKSKIKNIYNNNMDKRLNLDFKEIVDNLKPADIIPEDLLTNSPNVEMDDLYKDDDDDSEKEDIPIDNKNKKTITEKILSELHDHPITIPQRKSNFGFNPSVLIEKLRSVTPTRFIKKIEKIKDNVEDTIDDLKDIASDIKVNPEFQLLIKNIMNFIVMEIKSQHLDTDNLQNYQIFTKKLIYSLNQYKNK